tara:strand:- start:439 stop:687 length:249 start_codon:yes stop_codon:yes gene_type:complete
MGKQQMNTGINERIDYISERIRIRIMGAVRDTLYELDADSHETLGVQHRFHCQDLLTCMVTEGIETHQAFLAHGGFTNIENH